MNEIRARLGLTFLWRSALPLVVVIVIIQACDKISGANLPVCILNKTRQKLAFLRQWLSTFFMQRPILQPNLTYNSLPKISNQSHEMQLCLHNRKAQCQKMTHDTFMLNKDSFVKLIDMAASLRENRAVYESRNSTTH